LAAGENTSVVVWLRLAFYRIPVAKTLSEKPPDLGIHTMGIRPNLESNAMTGLLPILVKAFPKVGSPERRTS
jgi:hypothetical protein